MDTNVLLYSISTEPDEAGKRARAIDLLAREDTVLSVQVLQEFYVQSTRASRKNRLSHEQAVGLIQAWQRFQVQPINIEVLQLALELRTRHHWSYWDAAIVAAAIEAGCSDLLTEDLNDGQQVAGVTIRNPFATS